VHEFDIHAIERAGVDVVRRPTGGRSLLHHHEITYSVTAPAAGTLGDAYAGVNALLVNALGALGVPVSVAAPAPRAARPSSTPCFAEPAAGELVAGGAKLVGSAQWRDSGSMLQHGSILVDDDQPALSALMLRPPAAVPPAATLRALLGRVPSAAEVAGHLRDAVRALADPGADWLELERDVADEAARCALRFRDPAWTWRR
jgi:lipoate-protein ligase A